MTLEKIQQDSEYSPIIEFMNKQDKAGYDIHYQGKIWNFKDLKEYILNHRPLVTNIGIGVTPEYFSNATEQANELKSILKKRK